MTCPICGQEVLALTEEHVVPRRWGGYLTAKSCRACNVLAEELERGAEQVTWFAAAVGRAGVRGRSGRIREIETEMVLPDGGTAIAAHTREGLIPRVFKPRLLSTDADGKETWEVPEEQRDKFLARAKKRGKPVEILSTRRAKYAGGETGFGIGPANVALWPRLAAKFALGCAQHLEEGALDAATRSRLRQLFVQERWHGPDLQPLPGELGPDHDLRDLLHRDEHLLTFQPIPEGGGIFAFVLFGCIAYALPLPELRLSGTRAWKLEANAKPESTPRSFDTVIAELILRAGATEADGRRALE